jgi:hypothetical protein
MTDNPRSFTRDLRGRFTQMTPDDLVPENVSASDVRPGMEVPRHAPDADDLAGRPYPGALRPRGALLVQGDEEARTRYGIQGALGREAARSNAGPMDPIRYITGADDDGR